MVRHRPRPAVDNKTVGNAACRLRRAKREHLASAIVVQGTSVCHIGKRFCKRCRRMSADDDGAFALCIEKAGRPVEIPFADPDKVIRILRRKRCGDMVRCIGSELLCPQAGMHEHVRPSGNGLHDPARQACRPVEQIVACVRLHLHEPPGSWDAAIDGPVQKRLLILRIVEEVEHELLMVAKKDRRIRQVPAELHDLDRVRSSVDHVAQDVDLVVFGRRDLLEEAVERLQSAMYVRECIACHVRSFHRAPAPSL